MAELIILLQVASTLALVGLIWFVQVVHYPLFEQVGRTNFTNYEAQHQQRTTLVVAPLMLVEACTAFLLIWSAPAGLRPWTVWLGAGLVALLRMSTFLWQVPAHRRLSLAFHADTHRRLVRSNGFRTVAWTLRGILVCSFGLQLI